MGRKSRQKEERKNQYSHITKPVREEYDMKYFIFIALFFVLLCSMSAIIIYADSKSEKAKLESAVALYSTEQTITKASIQNSLKDRQKQLDSILENIEKLNEAITKNRQRAILVQGAIQQLEEQLKILNDVKEKIEEKKEE